MANGTFRAFPIYANGKKIAEAMTSSFDATNGGNIVYGIDGVLGVSDGIEETKIEWDTIVPVAGHQIAFRTMMRNRTYVDVGVAVDGGLEVVTGKIQGRSYQSEAKDGTVKGKFTFVGGQSQIT
jgi:hypothetical protein